MALNNALYTIPPMSFKRWPGTRLDLSGVMPSPRPADAGSAPGSIIWNWSGATIDTKRMRMLIAGEGHAGGSLNHVVGFSGQTIKWEKVVNHPLTFTPNPYDTPAFPGWRWNWQPKFYMQSTLTNPDGSPTARHSVGSLCYMPSLDQMFMGHGGGHWPHGGSDTKAWSAHMDGTWEELPPFDSILAGDQPGSRNWQMTVWDEIAGEVIYLEGHNRIRAYNPVTRQHRPLNKQGGYDRLGWPWFQGANLIVEPENHDLYLLTSGAARRFKLAGANGTQISEHLPIAGAVEAVPSIKPGYMFRHRNRLVSWPGGRDLFFASLEGRPSFLTWTKVTLGGDDPGPHNSTGLWKRIGLLDPAGDIGVLVTAWNTDVVFFNLGAGELPPDTTPPAPPSLVLDSATWGN